jgi:hypothetical protein
MITRSFLKLEKIKELKPAFCNGYGWLSIAELNLIDPYANRFADIEIVTFESGDTFINVVPMSMKAEYEQTD